MTGHPSVVAVYEQLAAYKDTCKAAKGKRQIATLGCTLSRCSVNSKSQPHVELGALGVPIQEEPSVSSRGWNDAPCSHKDRGHIGNAKVLYVGGNVSAPGARRASFLTRALPVDCCR